MTIRFPSQEDDPDDDALLIIDSDDEDDDEISATGTEASALQYTGRPTQAPPKMYFGARECGAIFTMTSDQGQFTRVCGCSSNSCSRKGHSTLVLTEGGRAPEGWYDTVVSRKFVDGKLGTHETKAERAHHRAREAEQHYQEIESAGAQWATGKSSSEEDSLYEEIETDGGALSGKARVTRSSGKSSPFGLFSPKTPSAAEAKNLSEVKNRIGKFFYGSGAKDPKEGMVVDLSQGKEETQEEDSSKTTEAMMGLMASMAKQMQELQADLRTIKSEVRTVPKPPKLASSFKAPPRAPDPVLRSPVAVAAKVPKAPTANERLALKALSSIAPQGPIRQAGVAQVSGPGAPPHGGSQGAPTGWWYAVAKGKDGASGIYDSWAEASVMVNGVSGAIFRKFRDYEDAWDFVQRYLDRIAANQTISADKNKPAAEIPVPIPGGAPVGNPAGSQGPLAAVNSFLPLLELAGPDPSTKKEDELFGIDMGSEVELRDGLCPPGLTGEGKRDLASSMVDVVALPGGYHGGVEEDSGGNDMALLGVAMQELVHQGRTTTENAMKSDLNWRSSKRTSLKEIRSMEQLRKRIKVLLKLRSKCTKSMMRSVRNACKRGGWIDQGQLEAWAQGGHFTRIVRDTLDWYLSLHQHLMGLAITDAPWSYVQVEIDHHVEEMEVIRNTQDSRLQALCSLYA